MSIAAEKALDRLPAGSVSIHYGRLLGLPPGFPAALRREIEDAYRHGVPVRCEGCRHAPECRDSAESACRAELEAEP